MKRGFTLIELLIVVAIIAILAAIAVPNFLEAQTRSKVSRTKAEMRTLATAVEAYYTDHNKPPPQSRNGITGQNPFAMIWDEKTQTQVGTGTLTYAITTPVAYITTFRFADPFSDANTDIDQKLYSWHPYQWIWTERMSATGPQPPPTGDAFQDSGTGHITGTGFQEIYGGWRLMSIGPDRWYYNQPPEASTARIRIPYDATNGTIHHANIIRSQKETDQRSYFVTLPAGGNNTGL